MHPPPSGKVLSSKYKSSTRVDAESVFPHERCAPGPVTRTSTHSSASGRGRSRSAGRNPGTNRMVPSPATSTGSCRRWPRDLRVDEQVLQLAAPAAPRGRIRSPGRSAAQDQPRGQAILRKLSDGGGTIAAAPPARQRDVHAPDAVARLPAVAAGTGDGQRIGGRRGCGQPNVRRAGSPGRTPPRPSRPGPRSTWCRRPDAPAGRCARRPPAPAPGPPRAAAGRAGPRLSAARASSASTMRGFSRARNGSQSCRTRLRAKRGSRLEGSSRKPMPRRRRKAQHLGPAHVQQRADEQLSPVGDPRQPRQPGPAHDPEQHRLGLVVGGVTQRDPRAAQRGRPPRSARPARARRAASWSETWAAPAHVTGSTSQGTPRPAHAAATAAASAAASGRRP